MDLVSKKILITGIDSFTGKHLSKYLKKFGYEVYGTTIYKASDKVLICNLVDKKKVKEVIEKIKPDFIIHLAAISFVEHKNSSEFYIINTIATQNILDSINYEIKKIILASSATVYGEQNNSILSENMCPNPKNHYGISKFAMEQIAKNYFYKFNIIITRPFNYTGIFQEEHFIIPKIVKHFRENKSEIELGNINVVREFNDISFVCEVYKRLLESDTSSEIFNIASSRGIKLLNIIDMMQKIAGYKINVKVNPKFIRKNEIYKLIGSNKKLFSAIGSIKQKDFSETLSKLMFNSIS